MDILDQSMKDKLKHELANSILKYMDTYKLQYNTSLKDYHNYYPNPNNLDPIETFKKVCQYNIDIADVTEVVMDQKNIVYKPKDKISGMIYVMEENLSEIGTNMIGLVKYTVQDIPPYDKTNIEEKINIGSLVNYNNKMIYIDARCISPTSRMRGLSEFLISLVLFYSFTTNNITGVIGSLNASEVAEVDINGIPHAKHMKGYAGCRINEYRNYYYQDIISATNMVTKCITEKCTNEDWEKYC